MKNKTKRLEDAKRRYRIVRVCAMVDDTLSQLFKDPETSQSMLEQATKVARWNKELIKRVGILPDKPRNFFSEKGLREYINFVEKFNGELMKAGEQFRGAAHYMAVWSFIMDVWCALSEYRVNPLRYLEQTFGTLTKMVLGVNDPDDSPAAEAGTRIYESVA